MTETAADKRCPSRVQGPTRERKPVPRDPSTNKPRPKREKKEQDK